MSINSITIRYQQAPLRVHEAAASRKNDSELYLLSKR